MVDSKLIGGILLVVGTSIGGGMLALPIVAADNSFWVSTLLLILCWAMMMFSALLVLEVNLWLPNKNNMISMANATLGKAGAIVAWISYLLLLYALISAYISGGSAIFHHVSEAIGLHSPSRFNAILFVLVFGFVVYKGIQPVDYFNRALMVTKFGALAAIISLNIPYFDWQKWAAGQPKFTASSLMIVVTSFGFATIVPSLRSYYNSNVKQLRFTIIVGSLIPLLCYIIWDLSILGTLPRDGENGLLPILHSGGGAAELTQSLSHYLHNPSVTLCANLFTSICVLTSFLSVSLGLSDFLADGLKLKKVGIQGAIVYSATFIPSLIIVLFYPQIFIKALSAAGVCCMVLLALLPALMAWRGRYAKKYTGPYQVAGGKLTLGLLIACATAIIFIR